MTDDNAIVGLGSVQGQPAFVEQLSATEYLAIGGSASATLLDVPSFAASMDGYVEYCVTKSSTDTPVQDDLYDCAPPHSILTRVRCESNKHRLNWDRR